MSGVVPRPRPRADRCPGALRVHQAADGALVRVRVPGGVLATSALRAIAEASRRLADGGLELTSRGNVQLRGLSSDPADAAKLAGRLADAGLLPSLTHETVRNVVASPLSGRDGLGSADIRGLADALDVALCDDAPLGGVTGLSGRFLFGLDDGRGDVDSLRPDLTWSAATSSVRVDRWDTRTHVDADDAPAALLAAARTFLEFRDAELHQPEPPERIWRVGHLADGGRALAVRLGADPETEPDAAQLAPRGPLPGPVTASDGGTSLVALAPLGRLDADQADLLAEVASAAGADQVVVTPWRSVVLDVFTRDTDAWSRALVDAGLVLDATSAWIGVTACAGTGCPRTLSDVRADATQAVRSGPPRPRDAEHDLVPVHWVGCERACGRPAGRADLVLATPDGYRVHHLSPATPLPTATEQPT